MSGYKVGIIIVILLLLAGAGVFWLTQQTHSSLGYPTEATASRRFMRLIGLAHTPREFMPIHSGAGAGHLYIAAYRYVCKMAPSDQALNKIDEDDYPDKNPIILHLAKMLEDAATRSVSRRYILFSTTLRTPTVAEPITHRINAMTTAVSDLGEAYLLDKHYRRAHKVFQAVMSMGYRLWIHGLLINERSNGLGTMAGATTGLKQLYRKGKLKNKALRHEVSRFQRAVRETTHRWLAKMKVIHVIDPNPADMVNVIKHDADISWRLAAINELGFARWSTPSRGTRNAIIAYLAKLERSKNPFVRQAAKLSLGLTASDMNTM